MKIPMTIDLASDPTGKKRGFLQKIIDNHGTRRDERSIEVYCVDDAGNKFRVFKLSECSSLWHIA